MCRPWGGQSCPDLAGQGSSSSVSLKAQLQSCSEWDLLIGSDGAWPWKQRHNSRGLAPLLGRLRRPAVGSASDLASYASLRLESPAVASAELTCTQNPTGLVTTPEHSEQGPPGCTCPQHPQSAASKGPLGPPSNRGGTLPRPAGFPMTEGAKGESAIPWSALPAAAQPLHRRPSVRRTRYYIAVTLQGRGEEVSGPNRPNQLPTPAALRNPGAGKSLPRGPAPSRGTPRTRPRSPGREPQRTRGARSGDGNVRPAPHLGPHTVAPSAGSQTAVSRGPCRTGYGGLTWRRMESPRLRLRPVW